jgi:hypothetical protein
VINLFSKKEKDKISQYDKFSVIVIWFFISFSFLIFLYSYWQSTTQLSMFFSGHYLNYYIISLISFCFWIVALFFKKNIRNNIAMIAISIVTGIYLVELSLYYYYLGVGSGGGMGVARFKASTEQGESPDGRSKVDVLIDLKQKKIVPSVLPMNFDVTGGIILTDLKKVFPLAGISRKQTLFCNENGYYVIYESDRYGFNNNDNVWDSRVVDLAMVGDSFTHGACVNPDKNISGSISKNKKNLSIVNLGISGNGPIIELASLVEYAKNIRPKKVLWIYYEGNDITVDLKREEGVSILNKYLNPLYTQGLIKRQSEIDSAMIKHIDKSHKSKLFIYKTRAFRLFYTRLLLSRLFENIKKTFDDNSNNSNNSNNINNLDLDKFAKIIDRAKNLVESWGGELYFVYLPSYSRYLESGINHGKLLEREKILNLVEYLDISIIDIHQKVFKNSLNPLEYFPYGLSGHYNEKGYKEIGNVIFNSLYKDIP